MARGLRQLVVGTILIAVAGGIGYICGNRNKGATPAVGSFSPATQSAESKRTSVPIPATVTYVDRNDGSFARVSFPKDYFRATEDIRGAWRVAEKVLEKKGAYRWREDCYLSQNLEDVFVFRLTSSSQPAEIMPADKPAK